jgi:hypothetical protein
MKAMLAANCFAVACGEVPHLTVYHPAGSLLWQLLCHSFVFMVAAVPQRCAVMIASES